jgi:hypothetical protein
MSHQSFLLQPFPGKQPLPHLTLASDLRRHRVLAITYTLRGNLADVLIPTPIASPERRHELWQSTCFEFFLAVQKTPQYWEFNLSPSGHWNVYRFTDYRQGMTEETTIATLPFKVQLQPNWLQLDLELDLDQLDLVDSPLDMAISTVIQDRDCHVTYWAIAHPAHQADFHCRDGFVAQL